MPQKRRQIYYEGYWHCQKSGRLGRIVIPKEIRRTLKIREGDPSYTTFTSEERFKRSITNIYIWCKNKGLCE